MNAIDYTALDDAELIRMERAIAQKYMQGISVPMVVWPFVNISVWMALWVLVFSGVLPLWVAFPIAVVNVTLSYLPSHEAQHDIYARPGEKLRWLNQLIGHFSLIPLAYSYRVLRETHMEHHKHTNHPELDPDFHFNQATSGWLAIMDSISSFQPNTKRSTSYMTTLMRLDTPETRLAIRDQIFIILTHFGVLFTCAALGYGLEALLLWWLPHKLGAIYIRYYLSWLPHYPGDEMGRYRDTRGFKSWLGVWSSLGMTAHIIHHLHPRIPLDRTPAALREMYPILKARGCALVG